METKINFEKSYIDVCRHKEACNVCPSDREGSAFNHMAGSYFGLITIVGTLPGNRKEKILTEMPSCFNRIWLKPLMDYHGEEAITNNELVDIIRNIKKFKSVTTKFDHEIAENVRAELIADIQSIHCEQGKYVSCNTCKSPRPLVTIKQDLQVV
jgi:hypothetical protein